MWVFYSLLGIISVFLVHIAMVLGGRELHGHAVWVSVVQKPIHVQRLGQSWVLSVQPEVIPITSSPKLCYVLTIQPWEQMLPVQEGGRCGSSVPAANHQEDWEMVSVMFIEEHETFHLLKPVRWEHWCKQLLAWEQECRGCTWLKKSAKYNLSVMEQWEGLEPFSLHFHEDPEIQTADEKSGLMTAVACLPLFAIRNYSWPWSIDPPLLSLGVTTQKPLLSFWEDLVLRSSASMHHHSNLKTCM